MPGHKAQIKSMLHSLRLSLGSSTQRPWTRFWSWAFDKYLIHFSLNWMWDSHYSNSFLESSYIFTLGQHFSPFISIYLYLLMGPFNKHNSTKHRATGTRPRFVLPLTPVFRTTSTRRGEVFFTLDLSSRCLFITYDSCDPCSHHWPRVAIFCHCHLPSFMNHFILASNKNMRV